MATDSHQHGTVGFGLPAEVVEDVLEEGCCRTLLACLAETHGGVAVDDLARSVVARRDEVDRASVTDKQRRQMREMLYESYLPKLTATGIVEYDSMRGTVELAAPGVLAHLDNERSP